MSNLIDKSAVVAEIERLFERAGNSLGEYRNGAEHTLISINDFLDTFEVKEVDFDDLGILANHLIACDAHLVTPKYTDKELNMLEELAKNNKAQKGE